jgi:hypothetical protein
VNFRWRMDNFQGIFLICLWGYEFPPKNRWISRYIIDLFAGYEFPTKDGWDSISQVGLRKFFDSCVTGCVWHFSNLSKSVVTSAASPCVTYVWHKSYDKTSSIVSVIAEGKCWVTSRPAEISNDRSHSKYIYIYNSSLTTSNTSLLSSYWEPSPKLVKLKVIYDAD